MRPVSYRQNSDTPTTYKRIWHSQNLHRKKDVDLFLYVCEYIDDYILYNILMSFFDFELLIFINVCKEIRLAVINFKIKILRQSLTRIQRYLHD